MVEEQGNFGILVGGGPAPGLNGVIAAVTMEACHKGHKVYGIYDGYKWLVKGDPNLLQQHIKLLDIPDVARIHFNGGSVLRTSRTNPVKDPNGVSNAVKMLNSLGISYMVTTGGDDTAYGASKIAEMAEGKIKFAHVPKTIDNDLPLPHNLPTFGYQTARELGSSLVKNLMEDANTTGRWYIVVVMGRTAGHLALGITKSAGATLAIIPEEFANKKIPLAHICDIFETAILKQRALGYHHGVLVIAEGVSDNLIEEDLKKAIGGEIKLDQFGHIPLADVALGKVLKQEIERRFKTRKEEFRAIDIDLGYVLRCADPIPFDQEYTKDLGYHAVNYLLSTKPEHQKNAIICVFNGELIPIYFEDMLDPQTKKTAVRRVDIKSGLYRIARSYMTRLEQNDFQDPALLKTMSQSMHLTSEEFKKRFEYLIA